MKSAWSTCCVLFSQPNRRTTETVLPAVWCERLEAERDTGPPFHARATHGGCDGADHFTVFRDRRGTVDNDRPREVRADTAPPPPLLRVAGAGATVGRVLR